MANRLKTFPNLIHVTIEGEDENQYYNVSEDGVVGIDVPGQKVAIYKLVEVGQVRIEKSFQASRRGAGRKK